MDEATFRTLADRHLSDVWRFARRRCVSADDADDVTSETFAAAWRRRDELPEGDAARLWLFGTARRVIANQRRSSSRLGRLREKVGSAAVVAPKVPDPAEVATDRVDGELRTALATLGDADRELLLMRAWDGLAVGEIASVLDITPNAVSVRLTKARTKLAAALGSTPQPSPVAPPAPPRPDLQIDMSSPMPPQKDPGMFRTSMDRFPTPRGGTR